MDIRAQARGESDPALDSGVAAALAPLLLELLPEAVSVTDHSGRIVFTNAAFDKLLGYERGELLGTHASLLIPGGIEEHERLSAVIEAQLRAGNTWLGGFPRRRKDGTQVAIYGRISAVSLDGQIYRVCVQSELAERQRIETALYETAARARAIVNTAVDGIITFDAAGTIESFNPAAEPLFGYPAEEAIGQNIDLLMPGFFRPSSWPSGDDAVERTVPGTSKELSARRKDGTAFPIDVAVSEMRLGKRRVFTVIVRDITLRKKAEQDLLQAKDLAENAIRNRAEFVANISHDLRTPLTIIMGYDQLLLEEAFGEMAAEQRNILKQIEQSTYELLELVNATIDLSRLDAGRLPVAVRELRIADLIEELREETEAIRDRPGLRCEWDVPEDLPLIQSDPAKIRMILRNLIVNALKFTDEGTIRLAVRRKDNGVEFAVFDNGAGIPEEALPIIFEPFRQAHNSIVSASGIGVGLYMARRLAHLLNGTISVESQLGAGSTFRVWLPITPASGCP